MHIYEYEYYMMHWGLMDHMGENTTTSFKLVV